MNESLEKSLYSSLKTILLLAIWLDIGLFLCIFVPMVIEAIDFLKYGVTENLTINNLLGRMPQNIHITPFNIPNWRGIEKILNWFFFQASAVIALLIIFLIYTFFLVLIFKNIDEKTTSKIFEDKKKVE